MDGKKIILLSIGIMTCILLVLGALLIKNSYSAPANNNPNRIMVRHIDIDTNREIVVPDVYICEESYDITSRELNGYKYIKSEGVTKGKCPGKQIEISLYYELRANTPLTITQKKSSYALYLVLTGIIIVSLLIGAEIVKNKKLS